jgi:putative ABC transport system permease protein
LVPNSGATHSHAILYRIHMIENFFKIVFRNLSRNKAFSFINIFGLSVGLATCILIMLYIFGELGYDTQNKDADRIFRIINASKVSGPAAEKPWTSTAAPIAGGLKSDMPEVEETTRLLKFPNLDKLLLKYEHGKTSKLFYETNGYYVDSNFFRIFTYAFKYGNAMTALNEPNSMVLSEEVSEKIFGNENPLNKTIQIGMPYGVFTYTVKGVYLDLGIKSHIPAHFYLSMRNGDIGTWVDQQQNWATNNLFHTYLKLRPGSDPKVFEKKLVSFVDRRAGHDLKALGVTRIFHVQPLTEIYLHSDYDNEISPNGNITYLYIIASIALFVLLIACINFMNLSTARSSKRAKEVGVRKVMGAEKKSLVYQFLGESMILSLMSLVLALCLAWTLLPFFNQIAQRNLNLFQQPSVWIGVTLLALVTGILSGIYPAFYLSAFQPVVVLKGKLLNGFSAVAIRKGLVVFQFTISICLVLGAMIISRQLHYMNSQDLGFNKNQQIVLPMQSQNAMKNFEALKNQLLKNPEVKNVATGSTYPGIASVEDMLFFAEGKTVDNAVDVHLAVAGNDYFETLGFTLLKGRWFSKEFVSDSDYLVLNEAALKVFGYDLESAVGRKLYYDFQGVHKTMQIVGVVKDFNFESLYHTIKPFAFNTVMGNRYSYVIVNCKTHDYGALLKDMEATWNRLNPDNPFIYSFLDRDFQLNYEKDQRASVIVEYFTAFAILIACLGLFGLAAFFAEQRTREIGIRKTLGATTASVTLLLTKDFIKLVIIAILIAAPLSWYGMNRWLENFSYRTPISWWMFVLAGLLAIFIALATLSYQSIKAALASPVKSLKVE